MDLSGWKLLIIVVIHLFFELGSASSFLRLAQLVRRHFFRLGRYRSFAFLKRESVYFVKAHIIGRHADAECS